MSANMFEIEGVQVSVDALADSGHASQGRIYADHRNPSLCVATYTHVMPGDRYDVTMTEGYTAGMPRQGSAHNLGAAVVIAKSWVPESTVSA